MRWMALPLESVASAAAQVIYGSLVGNVRDASDASIPGAVVRIHPGARRSLCGG